MAEVQTSTQSGELSQRFIEFVMMQAQNAALFLGQIPNPQTGQGEVNLELAKMFIDQLGDDPGEDAWQPDERGDGGAAEHAFESSDGVCGSFAAITRGESSRLLRTPATRRPPEHPSLHLRPSRVMRPRLPGRNGIAQEIHEELRRVDEEFRNEVSKHGLRQPCVCPRHA